MFTVIKLGGCNGSGKTTLAREIIHYTGAKPKTWSGTKKSPNYYEGVFEGERVLVLGSYETTCGGMDTISDKLERLAFIQWATKKPGIVFFEGLITGKTYGAIGAISDGHVARRKGRWIYAFMDTPFELCVQRVLERRKAKGNDAPFDPERTMRPTFRGVASLRARVEADATHVLHDVGQGRVHEAKRLLNVAKSHLVVPSWPA